MKIPLARPLRALAPLAAGLLLVAACSSGSGGSNWTFAPPTASAPGAGGSASPSASASASPSASPSASASASASPSASASESPSGSPGASAGGTTIQLDETADLRITDPNGQPVSSIPVKKGETYTFEITNKAGFAHDFYIGSPDDLQAGNTANLKGIPEFASGTKTFTYTFDTDGPIGFGCTVPGHYQTMHGTFDIQS